MNAETVIKEFERDRGDSLAEFYRMAYDLLASRNPSELLNTLSDACMASSDSLSLEMNAKDKARWRVMARRIGRIAGSLKKLEDDWSWT